TLEIADHLDRLLHQILRQMPPLDEPGRLSQREIAGTAIVAIADVDTGVRQLLGALHGLAETRLGAQDRHTVGGGDRDAPVVGSETSYVDRRYREGSEGMGVLHEEAPDEIVAIAKADLD